MNDSDIADELARIRQDIGLPRRFKLEGPANFELRPQLYEHVYRYSRGRCMDFAVQLSAVPGLRLAALYGGEDELAHAFLIADSNESAAGATCANAAVCFDVGGRWSLAEMRCLLKNTDGSGLSLRFPDRQEIIDQAAACTEEAAFDSAETVFAVAGCLPHTRGLVPHEWRVDDADAAVLRLIEIRDVSWKTSTHTSQAIHVP